MLRVLLTLQIYGPIRTPQKLLKFMYILKGARGKCPLNMASLSPCAWKRLSGSVM